MTHIVFLKENYYKKYVYTGPEMVPEARRSPGFILQPDQEEQTIHNKTIISQSGLFRDKIIYFASKSFFQLAKHK